MQYGFFFDSSVCTGCKTCVLSCKDYYDLSATETFRRVFDYEGGTWQRNSKGCWTQDAFHYHISLSCNHCTRPVCVHVCPTGAMHKEENGIVRVNSRVCIGCGYCTMACPYRAPFVSDETHTSTKCDGCYDRIEAGQSPICVEACSLRALGFDDVEKLRAKYGSTSSIAPMPEPETLPNIVIRTSPAAKLVGDKTGFVANPQEVQVLDP